MLGADLALALVVLPPAAGFRTGLARMPVAVSTVLSLALVAAPGTLFSFSGSWNVTVFFKTPLTLDAGLETADFKPGVGLVEQVVVIVPCGSLTFVAARLRATFLAGSEDPDEAAALSSVAVLRALVRVVLEGSALAGSAVDFFVRPRVVRVLVDDDSSASVSGSVSGSDTGSLATFFGRPRTRAGGLFMVLCCWTGSSGSSSDLVFRLLEVARAADATVGVVAVLAFVVLVVLVVAVVFVVVVVGAVVAAALVGLVGLVAVAASFAAALARVIRFGGVSSMMMIC